MNLLSGFSHSRRRRRQRRRRPRRWQRRCCCLRCLQICFFNLRNCFGYIQQSFFFDSFLQLGIKILPGLAALLSKRNWTKLFGMIYFVPISIFQTSPLQSFASDRADGIKLSFFLSFCIFFLGVQHQRPGSMSFDLTRPLSSVQMRPI